jgi:hypothetical protein
VLAFIDFNRESLIKECNGEFYAGAFVYGRGRTRPIPDGTIKVIKVARTDWQLVMPSMHEGYISWEQFAANQRRLAENALAFADERQAGPGVKGELCSKVVCCAACVGERTGMRYYQETWPRGPDLYLSRNRKARRRKDLSDDSRDSARRRPHKSDDWNLSRYDSYVRNNVFHACL